MKMSTRVVFVPLLVGALAVGASTGVAGAAEKPKTTVLLSEWIVKPKPRNVAAGKVTVKAKNAGGEIHELVILEGDDPDLLPTDADGAVIEDEVEDQIVGEIEDVAAGKTTSQKFRLAAGNYILFCNITEEEDDGTVESHFAEGMVNTITVR